MVRDYRVNERIRVPRVRVIGSGGDQLGVMTLMEALRLARENDLDLVEVSPNTDPPVCRILDYGKLRYLHTKKIKESRKAQKSTDLREVRFRPNIGDHDLEAKVRKVKDLLDDGAKVRIAVFFRGREMTHTGLGMALLKRVAESVKEEARLERPPAMEGRALAITLLPLPKKVDNKKVTREKDAEAQNP